MPSKIKSPPSLMAWVPAALFHGIYAASKTMRIAIRLRSRVTASVSSSFSSSSLSAPPPHCPCPLGWNQHGGGGCVSRFRRAIPTLGQCGAQSDAEGQRGRSRGGGRLSPPPTTRRARHFRTAKATLVVCAALPSGGGVGPPREASASVLGLSPPSCRFLRSFHFN